ncbi:MAG: hypothetical protein R3A13_00425 [Bdellovibrionota bacterium]
MHAREEFERLCGPSDSTLPDEKIDESRKDRRKRRKAAGGKDGKPSIPPYIRKIWDILVSVKRWIWK